MNWATFPNIYHRFIHSSLFFFNFRGPFISRSLPSLSPFSLCVPLHKCLHSCVNFFPPTFGEITSCCWKYFDVWKVERKHKNHHRKLQHFFLWIWASGEDRKVAPGTSRQKKGHKLSRAIIWAHFNGVIPCNNLIWSCEMANEGRQKSNRLFFVVSPSRQSVSSILQNCFCASEKKFVSRLHPGSKGGG